VIVLRAIFTDPVVDTFPLQDSAAMSLDGLSAIIEPPLAGKDNISLRPYGL
jgi:hypothetical protein